METDEISCRSLFWLSARRSETRSGTGPESLQRIRLESGGIRNLFPPSWAPFAHLLLTWSNSNHNNSIGLRRFFLFFLFFATQVHLPMTWQLQSSTNSSSEGSSGSSSPESNANNKVNVPSEIFRPKADDPKSFDKGKDLTPSQRAAVPPRRFTCEECGQVFAKKSALEMHFVSCISSFPKQEKTSTAPVFPSIVLLHAADLALSSFQIATSAVPILNLQVRIILQPSIIGNAGKKERERLTVILSSPSSRRNDSIALDTVKNPPPTELSERSVAWRRV